MRWLVLSLVASGCCTLHCERRDAERTARGTVVLVAVESTADGGTLPEVGGAQGSGVVIYDSPSASLVLTCAHVVEGRDTVLVSPDSPDPDLFGHVIKRDEPNDLALVLVDASLGGRAVTIAHKSPRLYERLQVAGAPNTTRGVLFPVTLSAYDHWMRGTPRWELSGGAFYYGISGGPVTFEGELVGIVTGISHDGDVLVQGVGLCVPLPAIRAFLAESPSLPL